MQWRRAACGNVPILPPLINLVSAHAVFRALGSERREVVGVAYLDPNRSILALRHIVGGRGHVGVSIRSIAADALAFDAAAVVIAHNHPSADARPSERDLAFTGALARALAAIDVALADHLILSVGGMTSLRATGAL